MHVFGFREPNRIIFQREPLQATLAAKWTPWSTRAAARGPLSTLASIGTSKSTMTAKEAP